MYTLYEHMKDDQMNNKMTSPSSRLFIGSATLVPYLYSSQSSTSSTRTPAAYKNYHIFNRIQLSLFRYSSASFITTLPLLPFPVLSSPNTAQTTYRCLFSLIWSNYQWNNVLTMDFFSFFFFFSSSAERPSAGILRAANTGNRKLSRPIGHRRVLRRRRRCALCCQQIQRAVVTVRWSAAVQHAFPGVFARIPEPAAATAGVGFGPARVRRRRR